MIRLTDEQWERIRMHFPEEHIPDGRPGRKPIPTRRVLEAVLWILNTRAQWHMLPQSYPNYKTVHRRFQAWCRDEILRRLLTDVANELRDRGALDEEECFIDATFVMAKGGGLEIGATKRGKGMKIMDRRPTHPRIHLFVRRGLSQGRHLRLFDHADLEYSVLPGLPRRAGAQVCPARHPAGSRRRAQSPLRRPCRSRQHHALVSSALFAR